MKELLQFELTRCFHGKKFLFALTAGTAISICHVIFSVFPLVQWLDSWQGDFFLTPHSVYGHWIGMDASTIWPTLLYLLFPLFAALPCADSTFWDFHSGYCMQIIIRGKKRHYLLAKWITVFVSGALVVFVTLCFNFALCSLFLPLVRPEALTNLYSIDGRSFLAQWFYTMPLLYTTVYIVLDSVFIGAWGCLVLASSVLLPNRLQSAISPFLFYLLTYFVFNWLHFDRFALFAIALPFQPAQDVSLLTFFVYAFVVPCLSFFFYFQKRERSDVL